MPTLINIEGVKVNIYFDHGPPHVHILIKDLRAFRYYFLEKDRWKNVDIPRPGAKAVRWILDNLPLVEREWRELNAPIDYKPRKSKPRKDA
jgi:hypothetical protein